MANIFAPFGFRQYHGGSGGAPTFAQTARRIAASNTTPVATGDPVMPVVGPANGYITRAVPGTTELAGIFIGCKYLSVAFGRTVWSNTYPGADAAADVEAYIIDDPASQFLVQTSGALFFNAAWTPGVQGSLPIGQLAQFAIGTAANGFSGAFLASVGPAPTSPFVILDYQTFPTGQNGTDPSTQFPNVIVGFNNQMLRGNAGVTGIS